MANVEIYTRAMCGFCARAKSLLSQKGVSFVEHDATFKPDMKAKMIEKSAGRATFPQIFIDDTHVGGCDDLFELERAGKLDAMLGA
ncbi:MAG: glutaredoxin 3 [Pseudomonadota bacterium]